jgi:hypothetical protein
VLLLLLLLQGWTFALEGPTVACKQQQVATRTDHPLTQQLGATDTSHAVLTTRQLGQKSHLYGWQFQAVVVACSTCNSKHSKVSKQAGSSEGWCPCAEPGMFVDT